VLSGRNRQPDFTKPGLRRCTFGLLNYKYLFSSVVGSDDRVGPTSAAQVLNRM